VLRARCLPPIPCNRCLGSCLVLPPDDRPIALLAARGGTIGSEDLARALDDAGRLGQCLWLRLDPADRDTGVFAHSMSHALERVFPGTGGLFVDELMRRPHGSTAPEELDRALSRLLPSGAVVVLEDDCDVANTRTFVRFGRAWARLAAPGVPLVVVAHGRPARRLRALAPPAPSHGCDVGAGSIPTGAECASALPARLADRLARVAAGRPALIKDVADAASAGRCDVVADVVATARNPRGLVAGLTDQLLASAQPDEIDALDAASRLGYWHPDLGSSVVTARLRPWLLPLQHDWHWLRPFWAGSLSGELRRIVRRRKRCQLRPSVTSRPVVTDAGHCWASMSRPERPTTVTVCMLGSFELAVDGRRITTWHGHLGPSVLKYLLAQPKRACHRDVLLDVFWPSVAPDLARNRLQVALSGVRRSLAAVTEAQLIEFHDGNYVMGQSVDVERDIDAFEQRIEYGRQDEINGNTERSIQHFKEAVAIYRGDFLEDSPYEEWAVLTRETLRVKYLDLLGRLARLLLKHDRIGDCIDSAQRILNQDACSEDAHRLLMRCYARQGRAHQARRQFDLCRRSLRDTMDVDPSPATIDLYRSLQATANADSVEAQRMEGHARGADSEMR
jgi:DNA-binding SARP family transcriptional activator